MSKANAEQFEKHPLFGEVPLVARSTKDPNGRTRKWLAYSTSYTPPLPKGAVRADLAKQRRCDHQCPQYFYVDKSASCLQCDRRFVFSAAEQKYWYETLGFHTQSQAIRCVACRKKQRSRAALNRRIAAARTAMEADPGDAGAKLEFAEATVRYAERTGQGNLDDAIAAAREAYRQCPTSHEALYWEAMVHLAAGRTSKAGSLLQRFAKVAKGSPGLRPLLREAKVQIEALEHAA